MTPRRLSQSLDEFAEKVEAIVARHALGPEQGHARFTLPDALGAPRDLGPNAYGAADAVNILYTLGALDSNGDRIAGIARFQHADGLFREGSHHPIHTTAHCIAALELLDAKPSRALTALAELRDAAAMERFLDALDWRKRPWTEAHQGAGLYAALHLAVEVDDAWCARYFDWLEAAFDTDTGLLRRGCLPERSAWKPALFPHLAGTFHYLFNMQYAGRAHPHPAALVDTCLAIFDEEVWPFATYVGFAEVDQVYCLHRAVLASGHRVGDSTIALRAFAAHHLAYLNSLDPQSDPGLDDLHALFGALCALAELQLALPDELGDARPLRQVLDRRPFI